MGSRRLEVVIAGNAAGATRALREVGAATGGAERRMSSLRRVGSTLAGVFAGVQLTQFFRNTVVAAEEAATVMRQTEAVIRSTGGAAGVSAGDLQRLSARLSEMAGVDDELVQQGGNVLLTFTNIKAQGGIFDDALTSALDMSSALGGDLQGSIMMIGRALNSPADGLSRLTRAGVTFSDSQRTQIEQMAAFGNTAGAQRVILDELAREFGGAAAANATATGQMSVAWENMQEQMGTSLLPAMEGLSGGMTSLSEGFASLSAPVQSVVSALALVGAAAAAAAAIFSSGWAAVGVVAIAAVGAQIYAVWRLTQPLRDLFFAVVNQLRQWWAQSAIVRAGMAAVGAEVLSALRSALGWVLGAFRTWWSLTQPVRAVLNVIAAIGMFVLRSAISTVIQLIRVAWQVSSPFRSVLSAIGAMAWGTLKAAISGVRSGLQQAWQATSPLRAALSTIGSMALGALVSAVSTLRSALSGVSSVLDTIASKIRSLPSLPNINIPGFASGTLAAPRGLAMVGEAGPELVRMRGGERVFTASQTRSMLKAGGRTAGAGGGDTVVHTTVVLDGQVVGRSVTRHQRRDARAYAGTGGRDY